jgi:hypothetical protein
VAGGENCDPRLGEVMRQLDRARTHQPEYVRDSFGCDRLGDHGRIWTSAAGRFDG